MANMGVSFQIPNEYGAYLSDILKPIQCSEYQWLVDNDEIHVLKDNEFTNEFLFKTEDRIIDGEKLCNIASSNTYYLIFVTLRAFTKGGTIQPVSRYREFLKSDCQIALGVYDCSYVMVWCKDNQLLSCIYNYALSKRYEGTIYISEEELLEDKYYIE